MAHVRDLAHFDGVWAAVADDAPNVAEAEARGLGPLFTGEFRVEERQTGRGERNSAVMSDAVAVVKFVRDFDANARSRTG